MYQHSKKYEINPLICIYCSYGIFQNFNTLTIIGYKSRQSVECGSSCVEYHSIIYLIPVFFCWVSSIPRYWDWVFNHTLLPTNWTTHYWQQLKILSVFAIDFESFFDAISNLIPPVECITYPVEYHQIHY